MGGLTSLLLLLCVGVTVSTVLDLQKRIEGGLTCKSERHYHVKILDVNNNFVCGGSLLKKNWILTAAHCWEWGMRVVLGAHPHSSGLRQLSGVITAPPVMFGDEDEIHDIMLLKLPERTRIQHVDLPDCGPGQTPPIGATVRVAGHGPRNARSDTPTGTLQCADIKVDHCPADIDHPQTNRSMFCGKTPGVKTFDLDSGGGVEYNGKIYGVIQGSQNRTLRAPVAQFMNVCRYKAWIQQNTGIP